MGSGGGRAVCGWLAAWRASPSPGVRPSSPDTHTRTSSALLQGGQQKDVGAGEGGSGGPPVALFLVKADSAGSLAALQVGVGGGEGGGTPQALRWDGRGT